MVFFWLFEKYRISLMLCWESHQTNSFIGFWFHQGISQQGRSGTRRQMEEEFHPPAPSLGLWRTQSSSSFPVYPLRSTNVQKYKYNTVTITITYTSVNRPMYSDVGLWQNQSPSSQTLFFIFLQAARKTFNEQWRRVQSRFGCLTWLFSTVMCLWWWLQSSSHWGTQHSARPKKHSGTVRF